MPTWSLAFSGARIFVPNKKLRGCSDRILWSLDIYKWILEINILTSRPKALIIWAQVRLTIHDGTAEIRHLASGCKNAIQWNLEEAGKYEDQLQTRIFQPGPTKFVLSMWLHRLWVEGETFSSQFPVFFMYDIGITSSNSRVICAVASRWQKVTRKRMETTAGSQACSQFAGQNAFYIQYVLSKVTRPSSKQATSE